MTKLNGEVFPENYGLPKDLKNISEASEDDLNAIKTNLDYFMFVYNRVWVHLDEDVVNRATKVVFAHFGYKIEIGSHHYCYQTEGIQ